LFKVLFLIPVVLAMDEQDDVLAAPMADTELTEEMNRESVVAADKMQDRNTRDANPGVPPIIQHRPVEIPHPVHTKPVHPPPHPAEPVHDAPHTNPEYTPKKPPRVPSKAKCTIEEVEVKAKICTPTYRKDCSKVKLVTKELVNRDQCFKIARTVCNEEVEEKDNELCVYEYNMEDLEGEAKTVQVDYKNRCETTQQEYCPPQQGYGHGYCKHLNTKVCYNEPSLSSETKRVTLGRPVASKSCQNNRVSVPKVVCEDVEVEKCIPLPYTEDVEVTLDKCRAELGEQECEETVLTLPKQVCEEIKEHYQPPPAAPVHHAPGPSYHAPGPAYHAPTAYQPPHPAYAG